MRIPTRLASSRLFRHLRALIADRQGVAVIEFAFVVPFMLCLYFVGMEASQGIQVSTKVSRMAYSVSDLITQQTSTTKADVRAILKIADSIIQPYNRSQPHIEVTAIRFSSDATPVGTVAWSLKLDAAGNAVKVENKGNIIRDAQIDKIKRPGGFVIRVKSWMDYKPVVMWSADAASVGLLSAFNDIRMGASYTPEPRYSTSIPCGDCP